MWKLNSGEIFLALVDSQESTKVKKFSLKFNFDL